jgi:hypothetical protein
VVGRVEQVRAAVLLWIEAFGPGLLDSQMYALTDGSRIRVDCLAESALIGGEAGKSVQGLVISWTV